jgi:hypothetical protein
MCPILEGEDMASVSTERPLLPEGEYLFTIKESEFSDDKKNLIIKRRVDAAPDEASALVGQENWDWVNMVKNDGTKNDIGWQTTKKYLEAVFGKGSQEASQNDTDVLNGHQIRIYITQKSYTKDGETKTVNNAKRYMAA